MPAAAFLIVIPVYNHAATLRGVVSGALAHGPVLVVDDGSTDMEAVRVPPGMPKPMPKPMKEDAFPESHPLRGLPVYYARHPANRGKGKAILTAAAVARALGMSHIITLDADAQHDPEDLPAFITAIRESPLTLFVGARDFDTPNVPGSSRFGRAFSNFWYRVQTGHVLGDTQSGYRAYPLAVLDRLKLAESHYSFETEVLVRASWAGFSLADIPVRVEYRPRGERVSHFRPVMDNVRLTLLNTRLTARAVMPVPQKRFEAGESGKITPLRPMRSLRLLLARNETPKNLALAGGLGVFFGTLPLIAMHSLTIILVLGWFRLNKIAGLATSQLCMPPLVPALCIEAGYYLRHGSFLTEISWQTLGREAPQRIWEWILGSLVLAPVLASACGVTVFVLAKVVRRGLARPMEGGGGKRGGKDPPRNTPEGRAVTNKTAWSSRSLGSRLQHGIFYGLIRLGGRRAAYLLLLWVVLWYMFKPEAARRSAPYLARRFPESGVPLKLLHRWRLQWELGKALVDRAAAGISGRFHVAADDAEMRALNELCREGRGLIMLASHMGSWHISMSVLSALFAVPVGIVLYRDAGDLDRHYFDHSGEKTPFTIIDPTAGPYSGIAMVRLLQQGGVLCIMGDRAFGDKRLCRVPFLGDMADFPYTAYYLASRTGAPVVPFFSFRTGPGEARNVAASPIRVPENLGKDPGEYAPYVREYVAALEKSTVEHPYQFFNFYNMWENDERQREAESGAD